MFRPHLKSAAEGCPRQRSGRSGVACVQVVPVHPGCTHLAHAELSGPATGLEFAETKAGMGRIVVWLHKEGAVNARIRRVKARRGSFRGGVQQQGCSGQHKCCLGPRKSLPSAQAVKMEGAPPVRRIWARGSRVMRSRTVCSTARDKAPGMPASMAERVSVPNAPSGLGSPAPTAVGKGCDHRQASVRHGTGCRERPGRMAPPRHRPGESRSTVTQVPASMRMKLPSGSSPWQAAAAAIRSAPGWPGGVADVKKEPERWGRLLPKPHRGCGSAPSGNASPAGGHGTGESSGPRQGVSELRFQLQPLRGELCLGVGPQGGLFGRMDLMPKVPGPFESGSPDVEHQVQRH